MLNIKDYLIDSDDDSEDRPAVSPPPREPAQDPSSNSSPVPLPLIPSEIKKGKCIISKAPFTALKASPHSSVVSSTSALYEPKKADTPLSRTGLLTPAGTHASKYGGNIHSPPFLLSSTKRIPFHSNDISQVVPEIPPSEKEEASFFHLKETREDSSLSPVLSPSSHSLIPSTIVVLPPALGSNRSNASANEDVLSDGDSPREGTREDSPVLHPIGTAVEDEVKGNQSPVDNAVGEAAVEHEEEIPPFTLLDDAAQNESEIFHDGEEKKDSQGKEDLSVRSSSPTTKKKFNKALFERLSKPLVIHQKYEERMKLEKARQAVEAAEKEQQKMEELAPISLVQWKLNAKRFQLRDLELHNEHFSSVSKNPASLA